jgi:hypothetical protein
MFLVSVLALAITAVNPTSQKTITTGTTTTQQQREVNADGKHNDHHTASAGDARAILLASQTPTTRSLLPPHSDAGLYRLTALGLLVNTLYLLTTIGILLAALSANRHGSLRHEQTLDIVKQQLAITRESNDISRAAHVTANRAIIDIGPLGDPTSQPITLDDGKTHTIPIEFKNIGRLPALDV